MKEARLKKLPIVWFHFIFWRRQKNYKSRERIRALRGPGGNYKGKAQGNLGGNEIVLCLDCAFVKTNRTEYQMSNFTGCKFKNKQKLFLKSNEVLLY